MNILLLIGIFLIMLLTGLISTMIVMYLGDWFKTSHFKIHDWSKK